jgi:hypothetical protein
MECTEGKKGTEFREHPSRPLSIKLIAEFDKFIHRPHTRVINSVNLSREKIVQLAAHIFSKSIGDRVVK